MMKRSTGLHLAGLLVLAAAVGCGETATNTTTTAANETSGEVLGTVDDMGVADVAAADQTAGDEAILVSFKTGDMAMVEVPGMSCQINCYPKVKKALEGITGVKSVELVPQDDEVVVNDHRVKIEFDGDVAGANALAALTDAGYAGSSFQQ